MELSSPDLVIFATNCKTMATPHKDMKFFILVDKSKSMSGEKIAKINKAVRDILRMALKIQHEYFNIEVKVSVLEFSSGSNWIYSKPMPIKAVSWLGSTADSQSPSLSAAYSELYEKLALPGIMISTDEDVAPAIILLSDGAPNDQYKSIFITELKNNKWFNAAIKAAVYAGPGHLVDTKSLREFAGDDGVVIHAEELCPLERMLKVHELTTSQDAPPAPSPKPDTVIVFDPETGYFGTAEFGSEGNYIRNIEIKNEGFCGGPSTYFPETKNHNPYNPTYDSLWEKIFGKKLYHAYSSIFAPGEVKRSSFMQVQVYLHTKEETEMVKLLAKESDEFTDRRDYMPLSLKLKKGDVINVDLSIYGEDRLMYERKTMIWQGSFTKCSFAYFVPGNISSYELYCEATLSVNGAVVGEMSFKSLLVDSPRVLNTEIVSRRFNKIFISYAHQDAKQVKMLAMAYKAQGVDYFYDRHALCPGDIFEEKIFNFIDQCDLFVLCWSKNAAMSDYVDKERHRAMMRAYPQISKEEAQLKICPISIVPRALLPADMKDVYNFEEI